MWSHTLSRQQKLLMIPSLASWFFLTKWGSVDRDGTKPTWQKIFWFNHRLGLPDVEMEFRWWSGLSAFFVSDRNSQKQSSSSPNLEMGRLANCNYYLIPTLTPQYCGMTFIKYSSQRPSRHELFQCLAELFLTFQNYFSASLIYFYLVSVFLDTMHNSFIKNISEFTSQKALAYK